MSAPSSTPTPPKRFMTPYEKGVLKRDAQGLRRVMEDDKSTEDARRNAAIALRRTEENLAKNSAPALNGDERDKVHKRTIALEEKLKVGLLSNEEMRRNPHGAVRRNVDYELANKHLITRWRNGIRALNPDAPQHVLSDMCSLERLRPRTSTMSMADCQIPQVRTMSFAPDTPEYRANYDLIDWQRDAGPPPPVDPHVELLSQFEDDDEDVVAAPAPTPAPVAAAPQPPSKPAPQPQQPQKGHPNQQRR